MKCRLVLRELGIKVMHEFEFDSSKSRHKGIKV